MTGVSTEVSTLEARLPWPATLLAGTAACLTLGVLETLKAWVVRRLQHAPHGLLYSLAENVPWWVLWAALLPVVIGLARTFRFEDARWRRSAIVHAVACVAVASLHVCLSGLFLYLLVVDPGSARVSDQVRLFVLRYFFTDVVIYAATLAAYYACEYFAGYRRSALAAAAAEARAARLQLSLAEARIRALRMELNPHFLFNTLNAIAGLVRKRQPQDAVEMLARLGDLLRTTLDRGMSAEVPLHEEVDLLRRYLDIELVRFGDRLRVTWELDPALGSALVPPLIMQPLVENALRHGIARRSGPAMLRISARRQGLHLALTVRDTGDGLGLHDGRTLAEGIGLSNIRARLTELYGEGASHLELRDEPGGGARACLLIPYHSEREAGGVAIGA
jgi:sensor histidine kinase YesM